MTKWLSFPRGGALLGVVLVVLVLLAFAAERLDENSPKGSVDETSSVSTPSEPIQNQVAEDENRVQKPPQRILPVIDTKFESPFVAVADRLKHSVVNITVKKEADFGGFAGFEDLFGGRSHPQITSGGSGVIIDSKGRVVTNHHVVEGGSEITVTLADGEERTASLIGADPETDLALLSIGEVSADWVATLGNSDDIRIGDWAVAMGNPLGLDWTLTVGVISAKGRSDLLISGGGPVFQDFIQTDAAINFGNSGGPLANIHGEVIGINAAVNAAANGIGFAIPINLARDVIGQLLQGGVVRRGYLGMVPVDLDPLKKEALRLDETVTGVFVESVSEGTPADRGGLRGSDVIVAIDGRLVEDVQDFRMRVARHQPGETLNLTILRDGKRRELSFTLADRSEFVASARPGVAGGAATWMGIAVAGMDSPQALRTNPDVESGVVVLEVDADSPAEGKLRTGDVITRVDGRDVRSVQDWQEVTSRLRGIDRAVLVMYFSQGKGNSRFTALKR
ncbi:MAG: trypsin-like peptidase domain-containing protein [bacterium]